MANHKSAAKRSIQSRVRQKVNIQYTSKIRSKINNFEAVLKAKDKGQIQQALSDINSVLSKAVKRGIIKKQHLSRKLSSLTNQTKTI